MLLPERIPPQAENTKNKDSVLKYVWAFYFRQSFEFQGKKRCYTFFATWVGVFLIVEESIGYFVVLVLCPKYLYSSRVMACICSLVSALFVPNLYPRPFPKRDFVSNSVKL